jgi:hypothetical protein
MTSTGVSSPMRMGEPMHAKIEDKHFMLLPYDGTHLNIKCMHQEKIQWKQVHESYLILLVLDILTSSWKL